MCLTEDLVYTRVCILGRLECRSPLHVGDGTDQAFAERKGRNDSPGLYRAVCLDADGKPYIPATTLRGHLRDRCATQPAMADRLFGRLEEAGRVRIFDATLVASSTCAPGADRRPYWDPERTTAIQHGIGINPITGTVGDHLLFRHEIVPEGARFSLRLEADDLDQGALAALLGLLASLDGGPAAAIGRGASRLQGRLCWTLDRVDYLNRAALAAWLDDADRPLDQAFRTLTSTPAAVPPPLAPGHQIRVRLRPLGPLLVNEPGLVTEDRRDPGPAAEADERHDPDLEFSRTPDGHARIPASSLRGLLRGRARRILVTVAAAQSPGCAADQVGDDLLGRLFGTTGRRGRLWIGDAVAAQPCDAIEQTFVAIDRFTGGGERHKLYQARAARCGILDADIRLDTRLGDLADWEKALLLLLARDALEGDLAAGWGKSRGYGALEVELQQAGTAVGAWTDPHGKGLLDWIGRRFSLASAQSWVEALHQEIATAITALHPRTAAAPR
ncbi:RAMP superfamily CRISPR-associated protein [uncultured Thiodictyon sp.]|jgi:CRISPR/Cas system CSM-associated protein Csm3 (group 7 of RAMP superfamily)|uniref:RAMP superfamily CRISPR-associated protein n=1 Tax=uncultured Thiodictyon sp. TaxID=1846217 RepID=UPI0025F28E5B|nr:RAMP superfamily CRISPR-associated protein [uncultured Thiodictyon sp.]